MEINHMQGKKRVLLVLGDKKSALDVTVKNIKYVLLYLLKDNYIRT
jgi:hypothetical protein